MTKPRILMADDHSIVLAGLRRLVESEGDVVGAVENGRSLVEEAQKLRPDIILLDISMPLLNGLDAARQLTKLVPESKLIFLTMHATPTYATEAFKAGASGYLIKRSAASELKQAIQAVMRGQHYMTPPDHKGCAGCGAASSRKIDPKAPTCHSDPQAARSAPTHCRRERDKGSCLDIVCFGEDGRISQVPHHGRARSPFHRRTHQVCHRGRPGRALTTPLCSGVKTEVAPTGARSLPAACLWPTIPSGNT